MTGQCQPPPGFQVVDARRLASVATPAISQRWALTAARVTRAGTCRAEPRPSQKCCAWSSSAVSVTRLPTERPARCAAPPDTGRHLPAPPSAASETSTTQRDQHRPRRPFARVSSQRGRMSSDTSDTARHGTTPRPPFDTSAQRGQKQRAELPSAAQGQSGPPLSPVGATPFRCGLRRMCRSGIG